MNSADLRQLTTAKVEHGTFNGAEGQTISFIDLHLGFLHQGTHHSAPVLTLSPDQARSLALLLQTAADKAQTPGRSGAPH